MGAEPRVTLFSGEVRPGTSTYQGVFVSAGSGDLVFDAQDLGELPRELFDDSDYEWWVRVAAADKPRVAAALRAERPDLAAGGEDDEALIRTIEAVFGGRPDAVDAARQWLDEQSIAYEFSSWI